MSGDTLLLTKPMLFEPEAFGADLMFKPFKTEVWVRQLRHHFDHFSRGSQLSSPHARRVIYYTWCPCLSDADWCFQRDGMPNSPLQVLLVGLVIVFTAIFKVQ